MLYAECQEYFNIKLHNHAFFMVYVFLILCLEKPFSRFQYTIAKSIGVYFIHHKHIFVTNLFFRRDKTIDCVLMRERFL